MMRKNLYENFIHNLEILIKANSEKIVSAVILYEDIVRNGLLQLNKTSELYNQLKDAVKYSELGLKIGDYINNQLSVEVGKAAPYFKFTDIEGKNYDLDYFKNKAVLLHFWASTCGPCRVENRELVNFHKNNSGLNIINIALDISSKQWRNAVMKDGLTEMINTTDLQGGSNKIAQDYFIHGIPAYYLINVEGKISAKGSLKEIEKALTKMR